MRRGLAGCATMLLAAALLAACASTQSGATGGPATAASGSASASAAGQVLIVIPENTGTSPTSNKVDLVHPDGRQQSVLTVRQDATVLAAAGSHVIVLVQHSGGLLKGIAADGTDVTLGSISTDNPNGFVISPDGQRWLWGNSSSNGQTVSSAVEEGGVALSPIVVAQETANARALVPFAWTKLGPTVTDNPVGIGGYIQFVPALGPVRRLDPDLRQLTPISTPSGCNFSDLATDGTIACVTQRNDRPSVAIVPRSGSPRVISLSLPRFTLMGDAYFSPDGKLLTVAGAEGLGMQPPFGPERFGVDLITVADGSIRRFGPDGLRTSEQLGTASWLPDGSLVLWRPAGAAGGDPGTYVVSPDGHAAKISAFGPPIGVLTP